jgi:hypothetical protein
MRFVCGDVRDLIVSYKKRPRPFVSALQSVAAVEAPKNQLLQIFGIVRFWTFATISANSGPSQTRLLRRGHSKVPVSVHLHQYIRDGQAGAMCEFICEFAALEPPPPELQQLFRTVHGNQAAMDGFGEYRSDLPLREAQLILEEYLRPRPQNNERILDKLVEVLERPDLVVAVSRLQRQSSLAVR